MWLTTVCVIFRVSAERQPDDAPPVHPAALCRNLVIRRVYFVLDAVGSYRTRMKLALSVLDSH